MKGRESGMPEEDYWQSFFDADGVVETLFDAAGVAGDLVEFGCGYGTFTLPAARCTRGVVTALDIEPLMVARVRQKAEAQVLLNVRAEIRDFVSQGTGLVSATQSHAMIFNLLHLEQPLALLREAHRTLHCGGTVAVMHWRSDVPTPRGHALDRLGDGYLPVVIGDDLTDETAFEAFRGRGLTVRVGRSGRSSAGYFLKNQGEVAGVLARLLYLSRMYS